MATKDYFSSSLKGNPPHVIVGRTSDGQYNNLNLNHSKHNSNFVSLCSENKRSERKNINITSSFADVSQARKNVGENEIGKFHEFFNSDAKNDYNFREREQYQKEKNNKESGIYQSSLLDHISAYENSVDDSNVSTESFDKNFKRKEKFDDFKKAKNAVFVKPKKDIQDPFSSPRQQYNDTTEPETTEFKVSQRLFNASSSNSKNNGNISSTNSIQQQQQQLRKSARLAAKKQAENDDQNDENLERRKDQKKEEKNSQKTINRWITCFNGLRKPVKHWIILKFPGKEFGYIDSLMLENKATEMERYPDITAKDTALYHTLAPYFEDDKRICKVSFNDQQLRIINGTEEMRTFTHRGHMKGIIFYKDGHGVFISHSVPGLPVFNKNIFPSNALVKGQDIFATNIDEEMFAVITEHLFAARPCYYPNKLPAQYKHIGKLKEIFAGTMKKDGEESYSSEDLKDEIGSVLISDIITRCNNVKGERTLFKGFVDEIGDLYAVDSGNEKFEIHIQSWWSEGQKCQNKDDDENAYVHNIKDAERIQLIGTNIEWVSYSDHSKYGFSKDGKMLFFFDLNHTNIKKDRGGSCYCIKNGAIVKAIKATT